MQQGSATNSDYEYKANVKEKVKMLEASMYTKEDDRFRKSNPSRKRSTSESSARPSSTDSGDEVPAVMDVEMTQFSLKIDPENDSFGKDNKTLKSQTPTVLRNGNSIDTDHDDDTNEPRDVKSLLKKFTNGVSQTALNIRRKSAGFIEFRNNNKIQPTTVSPNKERIIPTTTRSNSLDPDLTPESAIDENLIKAASNGRRSFSIMKKASNLKIPDLIESTAEGEAYPTDNEPNPRNILLNKSRSFWGRKASSPIIETVKIQSPEPVEVNNNEVLIQSKEQEDQNLNSKENQEDYPSSDLTVVQRVANYAEIMSYKSDEMDSKGSQSIPKPKPRPRTEIAARKLDNIFGSILVMGPQGSGKSSIVNYLVRQDILTLHKDKSFASEIVECTTTIKLDDANSQEQFASVKIIDTPGFSNDGKDASLISTLIWYISSHEGLQTKSPILILVPLKYKRTGSYTDSSEFINFLKCLSHFQANFINETIPNVLFVLTHLPLDEAHIDENVSFELSSIISKYTSLIKPMIIYHQLNQPDENSNNSSFQMESKFKIINPNLIDGIRKFTSEMANSSLDGHTALKLAFGSSYPNSIIECTVSKRIPLKGPEYPPVIKMQKVLHNIYLDAKIEPTEISTLLEIGWENIDQQLRQKNQSSLLTLQQVFQNNNIRSFSDLPEEPLKVLDLLNQIPYHNLAITDLLTETIQLKVPSCYPALCIGQGFDVSKDVATQVSPFQFSGNLKTSPVGLIPEEIGCKLTEDREIIFKFFPSYGDYVLDRFKDLSIKYVTFPTNNPPLMANQRSGYNVIKPNQEPTKSTISTALIEYRMFKLSLCTGEDVEFKPQFWETISSLPELDIKKAETIETWKEFFGYWGTHVVKSAYGGGSIQVNFRGKMLTNIFKALKQDSILPSDEYETSNVFQYITGDGLSYVTTTEGSKSEFIQGCDVDTRFQGGDMKFQQMDLTKIAHEKVAEIREEWIRSLLLNPVILETNLALVPISFFVRVKSEGIATKMDVAFHHFYSNFMALQGKSACSIL